MHLHPCTPPPTPTPTFPDPNTCANGCVCVCVCVQRPPNLRAPMDLRKSAQKAALRSAVHGRAPHRPVASRYKGMATSRSAANGLQ